MRMELKAVGENWETEFGPDSRAKTAWMRSWGDLVWDLPSTTTPLSLTTPSTANANELISPSEPDNGGSSFIWQETPITALNFNSVGIAFNQTAFELFLGILASSMVWHLMITKAKECGRRIPQEAPPAARRTLEEAPLFLQHVPSNIMAYPTHFTRDLAEKCMRAARAARVLAHAKTSIDIAKYISSCSSLVPTVRSESRGRGRIT